MARTVVEFIGYTDGSVDSEKMCEFQGHKVPTVAPFYVLIGSDYGCRSCEEHAKVTCENCEEYITNGNLILHTKVVNGMTWQELWCRGCDTADYVAGIAD